MKALRTDSAPPNDTAGGEDGFDAAAMRTSQNGSFLVRLDQYEGPLDALLDLIKNQQIDVLDLPIAKITEQYLASVRVAQDLDFEFSAEFVMMAATLIHVKSKALLPAPPTVEDETEEDPREDLVQRLLEREKFLQAAQMLKEKRVVEENVWTAGAREALEETGDDTAEIQVSLFDLVTAFGDVLERIRNEPVVEMSQESVTVASRIQFLKQLLLADDGPISIRRALFRQRSTRAVVATFLALLEMVKARAIELRQETLFGEILIQKHARFDEAFESGELFPASDAELEYSH